MMQIITVKEGKNGRPKSGIELYMDAKAANKTSHNYIQNRCLELYISKNRREWKDTKDKIVNLKKLRTSLEYHEADLTNKAILARTLSIELRTKLEKHV